MVQLLTQHQFAPFLHMVLLKGEHFNYEKRFRERSLEYPDTGNGVRYKNTVI